MKTRSVKSSQVSALTTSAGADAIARLAELATNDSHGESFADILGRAGLVEIEGRGKSATDPASQASYAKYAHGAVFAEVKVDPDLGQMHDGNISAPAVYSIPPQPRHRQTDTPTVLPWIRRRLRRNIVAVKDSDRDFRQRHELRQRRANRS